MKKLIARIVGTASPALFLAALFAVAPALCDEPAENAGEQAAEWSNPTDWFPIFPWDHLGSWGEKYQPLQEGIKSMAECEFTLSGFVDTDEGVKYAKENGLRCILEARFDQFRVDSRPLSEEELGELAAKIDAHIKERVEATKNDPSVIGYSLTDEPGAYHFASLAAAVRAIKKYAPGKLAYINLFPGYASTIGADADSQLGTFSYEEYLERFVQEVHPQLLSYDNYMIEYSEDMTDAQRAAIFFSDLFAVRKTALRYDLPFWFIGSSLCIMKDSSPPTPARYAVQSYVPLAAGAQGLTWFLYYPLGWIESPIDQKGQKTISWLYMRDINIQMKTLGLRLLKYRSTAAGMSPIFIDAGKPRFPEIPTGLLKNLSANYSERGVFDESKKPRLFVGEFEAVDGKSRAAMAVNLDFGSSVKIKFDLPEGCSVLKTVSPVDGSETEISEEALKDGFWLIPGHGKLFIFE